MKTWIFPTAFAMFCLSLLTALAAPAETVSGNAISGYAVYRGECSDCHSNKPGVDRFGPTLAGVYGRMSGTAPLHRYSKAMLDAHIVWNAKTLDAFLRNPRADIHGTIMPFDGIASAHRRADVIAYLRSISPGSR